MYVCMYVCVYMYIYVYIFIYHIYMVMCYDVKVEVTNFKENAIKRGTGRSLILKNDFIKQSF